MNQLILRRAGAELIGTYVLVAAGCGAIMVNAQTGALSHIGVALSFGLALMVMIAAVGHISGGHFNPAVTIAFALTRHLSWRDVPFYLGGQLLGALLAALTLRLILGDAAGLGTTMPAGSVMQAFALEVLLTAVLMFVIISVATDARAAGQIAAIAIGMTVTLGALWGGPISGASMNPARSLAPALVAGIWDNQWIYLLAPVIGAALGALLYEAVRSKPDSTAA
jgi:aquaporin NIP